MLKKSIGLTAAALALGVFGLIGNGCSSSSPGATGGDEAGSTDAKVVKESGPGSDGSTIPACYAPGSGTVQFGPVVFHQGVCTSDQINSYWDFALNQDFDAGPDAGGAFQEFVQANVPCVTCLVGPLNPAFAPDAGSGTTTADGGTYPAPVEYDDTTDGVVFINLDGCAAAISTSGGDDTCVESVENQAATANFDCGSCVSGDDANFTNTTACVDYDETSGNAATITIDSTCASAVKAVADADLQSKCGEASTFEDTYKGLALAFCGP